MKSIVLLLGLATLASAYLGDLSPRLNEYAPDTRHYLMAEDRNGNPIVMNLRDTRLEKKATLEDVTYYFYTKQNANNPVVIQNNNITTLEASGLFKRKSQTVFIIHGWENDHTSPVNELITAALLETYDVNVFVVDWGDIATRNYFTARFSVKTIGNCVGAFLNDIAEHYKKSYKDFILIGHSLGAHVAGVAGSCTKEKVDHIIGLDPAEPLFTLFLKGDRLDQDDADFVCIIHTNGGFLGFSSPLGHADYYPNGGSSQPGCHLEAITACSHARSYVYYADSLKTEMFVALRCSSYHDFKENKCNDTSIMGRLNVDKTASGNYYLSTKSKEPYAPTEKTIELD